MILEKFKTATCFSCKLKVELRPHRNAHRRKGGMVFTAPHLPSPYSKRERTRALQDAARGSQVISQRAGVLECGRPRPLFCGH